MKKYYLGVSEVKISRVSLGVLLILMGTCTLFNNIFNIRIFSMAILWPLIILAIGFIFELSYFSTKQYVFLLLPGGILITLSILFIFETMTNWHFAKYTWPIYPLSVAIGLLQVYVFGKGQKLLLLPIAILCAVSFTAFACMIFGNILGNVGLVAAIVLIIVGVYFILKKD